MDPAPPRRWHREPLLHFVLLGAALFAVDAWRHAARPDARRVVYDRAFVDGLARDLARRDGRPPTRAELAAAVDRLATEEVLYREGLALGLDRGDTIVRRRVVQKMEFLLEDATPPAEPTDAELAAHLRAHPERYARAARVSLRQVFLDRGRRGARADADALALRAALARGDDASAMGDPFAAGPALDAQTERDLAALLGDDAARAVFALPPGAWSAPLASRYGLHLVRVTARSPGALPPLDEARAQVRTDLLAERTEARRRDALRAVVGRYDVVVEMPGEGAR